MMHRAVFELLPDYEECCGVEETSVRTKGLLLQPACCLHFMACYLLPAVPGIDSGQMSAVEITSRMEPPGNRLRLAAVGTPTSPGRPGSSCTHGVTDNRSTSLIGAQTPSQHQPC